MKMDAGVMVTLHAAQNLVDLDIYRLLGEHDVLCP